MHDADVLAEDALYLRSRDLGSDDDSMFVISASTTFGRVADVAAAVARLEPSRCIVRPLAGVVRASWDATTLPPIDEARHGVERLRAAVRDVQGTVIADRMPPAYHEGIDTWGEPPGSVDVMRRVKAAYDPDARLNRGRFIGGI